MPRKPLVALVGRPNVGKSTLFNRMVGQRISIVEDIPGTTRDRLYADVEWGGRVFTVIDTGGLVLETRPEDSSNDIIPRVRAQAQIAIDEADVIVMLTDIEDGLTAPDLQIADLLRRTDKPIILVANKVDNRQRALDIHEFYTLGLGDPLSVSALRGTGTGDLLDAIAAGITLHAGGERGRVQSTAYRSRGSHECWQIVASQPLFGRGTGDCQSHTRHHA